MGDVNEVSSMGLRLAIDSYEDILGSSGKNSILNFAGYRKLIETPPAYDEGCMVPRAYLNGMIRASVEIIGEAGTRMIVMRAGINTIGHLVEHNRNMKKLAYNMDIPKAEKLKALLTYYSTAANRPPLFEIRPDIAIYRVPGCTLCAGMKTERPSCVYVAGVFEGLARFIAGYKDARCEEVECKATGGTECRYEIYFREQGQ